MIDIIPNWHPIFVHFTIALLSLSTALFIIGAVLRYKQYAYSEIILHSAYVNLWCGALITIITISAGFYAYYTVSHDDISHLVMKDHRNWALATSTLFVILTGWSIYTFVKARRLNFVFLILMVASTISLSITGWKGGELVYRYGIGVISLPQAENKLEEYKPQEHEKMPKPDGHNHNH